MNKIEICKKCDLKTFSTKQGVICSLTNEKPVFETSCNDFTESATSLKEAAKEIRKLRPNKNRSQMAIILIWVAFAVNIVSIISFVMQYSLLQAVSFGEGISADAADINDARVRIISIISLIIWATSGITFIMWFRRAYYNLGVITTRTNYTDGWAAGCWFVPIISLYRPYQIMKELYSDTKRFLDGKDISHQLETRLLSTWWTLWLVHVILDQIINKIFEYADNISLLSTCTILFIIDGFIFIGLSFVTLRVVNDFAKAEVLLLSDK